MNLNIKGKIAVVTGANTGIGLSIAEELASEGVHLILCARRQELLFAEAEKIQRKYAVNVHAQQVDVTNMGQIASLCTSIGGLYSGGVDFLINNAGANTTESIFSAEDSRWYYEFDRNVMAIVRLVRLLANGLIARQGVIINISSIYGKQPGLGHPIFSITKSAMVMLSKCLSQELIRHKVRVNCVLPGPIWVEPNTRHHFENIAKSQGNTHPWEAYAKHAGGNFPMGRFGTVEEVSKFVCFLCSPHAAYTTGANFYIDGGCVSSI